MRRARSCAARALAGSGSCGPDPFQNSVNWSIASSTDPFQMSSETSRATCGETRVQPPVRIALAQQRRQHRLDQRQAAQAMRERRSGRDLERNRAAIGMADEMDRSLRVVERAADGIGFLPRASAAGPARSHWRHSRKYQGRRTDGCARVHRRAPSTGGPSRASNAAPRRWPCRALARDISITLVIEKSVICKIPVLIGRESAGQAKRLR